MSIVVESVSLRAGDQKILVDIDTCFEPGRITAVLGPNGAGKSSLLSILANLRKPDRGIVRINGRTFDMMRAAEYASMIAYLPQAAPIHWDLDVEELVALGRYVAAGPLRRFSREDRSFIDGAMQATGTQRFRGRNVLSLSGGERARVLLARALAGEPAWLLADEPLANLDPAYQIEMMDTLRRIGDTGTGIVMVLHDLALAHWYADSIVVLNEGRVVAQGGSDLLCDRNLVKDVWGVESVLMRQDGDRDTLVIMPHRAKA